MALNGRNSYTRLDRASLIASRLATHAVMTSASGAFSRPQAVVITVTSHRSTKSDRKHGRLHNTMLTLIVSTDFSSRENTASCDTSGIKCSQTKNINKGTTSCKHRAAQRECSFHTIQNGGNRSTIMPNPKYLCHLFSFKRDMRQRPTLPR